MGRAPGHVVAAGGGAVRESARHAPWRALIAWLSVRRRRRDLLIVCGIFGAAVAVGHLLEPAEGFHEWAHNSALARLLDIDQWPFVVLCLAVAFTWYATRRIGEHSFRARLKSTELASLQRTDEALRLANKELEARIDARVRELQHETSQRTAAEAAATRLQTEVEHLNRLAALDLMTVGLAHELSHPLFALNNYLKGILARSRSRDFEVAELVQASEKAIEQSERATAIVHSFREFARRGEPSWQRLDPVALVRQCGSMLAPIAERSATALSVETVEPVSAVSGDWVQLEQVIVNLTINALEAMSGAGSVRRRLTIGIRPGVEPENSILLTVADTGPGVAAGLADRIFEPFVTTKEGGTGMGLAICRSIIESHGGSIRAETNADAGTTFIVDLPPASE